MKKLEWVTNWFFDVEEWLEIVRVSQDEDFQNAYIQGEPKATDSYTSEQLKAIGGIGIYKEVEAK